MAWLKWLFGGDSRLATAYKKVVHNMSELGHHCYPAGLALFDRAEERRRNGYCVPKDVKLSCLYEENALSLSGDYDHD